MAGSSDHSRCEQAQIEAFTMDDTLQRLLDAEMKAENLAREAEEERERTIRAATLEARELDEAFSAKIPTLQQTWIARSEERAANSIAEIERRYDERHERLRDIAEEREDEALNAGFRILMDSRL
jgi:V/A-type H+/Na+-transporting ATPase subunit G/H